MSLRRIISGGQTGVDRAALDSARIYSYSWGGWAPRGRISEEAGGIPEDYFGDDGRLGCGMKESESSRYSQRTAWNIRDSDATMILRTGKNLGPGTKLTIKMLRQKDKLYRICDPYKVYTVPRVVQWICEAQLNDGSRGIEVLNIAGSRESRHPGIQARSKQFLTDIWGLVLQYETWGIKIWDPKRSRNTR